MHLPLTIGAVLLSLLAAVSPPPSDYLVLEAAKNVGLAALEEGDLAEAGKRFAAVRKLAPGETLGWANGAVAAMRGKDLVAAQKLLNEALRLAGGDARVLALEGLRLEQAGDASGAILSFEKAAAARPGDIASEWNAARLSAERGADGRKQAIRDVEEALKRAPVNLFLLLRLSEYARESGDAATALAVHERVALLAAGDAKLDRALAEAKAALAAGDARAASLKYRIVENLLRTTPRYQQARHDVDPGVLGIPLEDWSPDLAEKIRARSAKGIPVAFAVRSDAGLAAAARVSTVRPAGKDGRDLVLAGSGGLRVARAGPDGYRVGPALPGSASEDLAVADVTNSGGLDLVTPGVLWIASAQGYTRTPLPAGERVAVLDFDSDGDLDVYVSSKSGDRLSRNNLDGTWTDVTAASGMPPGLVSRMAVAGDFDRDGDVDLLAVKSDGGLTLLDNLRGGRFAEKEAGLPKSGAIREVAAGDLNGGRTPRPRLDVRGDDIRGPESRGWNVSPAKGAGWARRHASSLRLRQRRLSRSVRGESEGSFGLVARRRSRRLRAGRRGPLSGRALRRRDRLRPRRRPRPRPGDARGRRRPVREPRRQRQWLDRRRPRRAPHGLGQGQPASATGPRSRSRPRTSTPTAWLIHR